MSKERAQHSKEKERQKQKKAKGSKDKERVPERLGAGLDFGEFDYDALKADDDAEIWLIRVPADIKPKHLADLQLDAPRAGRSGLVGSLARKERTYDVWASDPRGSGEHGHAAWARSSPRPPCSSRARPRAGSSSSRVRQPRNQSPATSSSPPRPHAPHAPPRHPLARPPSPLCSCRTRRATPTPAHILTHSFRPLGATHVVEPAADYATMEVEEGEGTGVTSKDKGHEWERGGGKKSKDAGAGKKRKGAEDSPKVSKKAKRAKVDS
ncbi:hypothetical protein EVG20_g10905 [Dentipellis fragilis]|uniref:Uncharacterized protein n=1 Tax=Dentipellis fragilis TaxID=205917 RepID=A0A4Y9XQJ9_9AGAM|nr:hypothetical protein EVG20_g10905 [Dentipellis fragilis]